MSRQEAMKSAPLPAFTGIILEDPAVLRQKLRRYLFGSYTLARSRASNKYQIEALSKMYSAVRTRREALKEELNK